MRVAPVGLVQQMKAEACFIFHKVCFKDSYHSFIKSQMSQDKEQAGIFS